MAKTSLIPGFRFHPTDAELVMYYLKRKLLGKKIIGNAVAEVNIYEFGPWDLPDKSSLKSGDLEWYFFCPKSKKYSSGCRSNRATEKGFWKATGKDRRVIHEGRCVATIKTLVYHIGHAGNGQRTDWVMHEYKMEDEHLANAGIIQDKFVLCKIFEKSGSGPKNGAQYGAPFNEEEWDHDHDVPSCSRSQAVVGQDVGAINGVDLKQKGPATITEPGSSTVTFSLNKTVKTLDNNKQKDPATITEPGSSSVTFHANDDVMRMEDLDSFMEGVEATNSEKGKGMAVNEDAGIYDDLVNLLNLDDFDGAHFKTDGAEYTLDKIFSTDDLDVDLRRFYVD